MAGYEETLTIEDRTYTVRRLPWGRRNDSKSMRTVLAKLTRLCGKSIKSVATNSNDVMIEDIIGIIASIIGELDSDDASDVLDAFGSYTVAYCNDRKKAKELSVDRQSIWWQEYPGDFWQWLGFAIKVNYADFFTGVKNATGSLKSKSAGFLDKQIRELQSLKTSIGIPGELSEQDTES
jgi:hypothetical protein